MQPGGAVRKIGLLYRPARLGIDYQAPLKVQKYGLCQIKSQRSVAFPSLSPLPYFQVDPWIFHLKRRRNRCSPPRCFLQGSTLLPLRSASIYHTKRRKNMREVRKDGHSGCVSLFGVGRELSEFQLRLAISDKKLFRGRRNRQNNWFVRLFRLFRGTEKSRKSVPNLSAEEKTTRNSIPQNKNRSKHLEYCSEPFRSDIRLKNIYFRQETVLQTCYVL